MALQKREKILLGVMGAAVTIFVLNQFVFTKKPSAKPPAIVKKPPVVQHINRFVKQASFAKTDRPKITKKIGGWKRDPFIGAFTPALLDSMGFKKRQMYVLKAISWKNGKAYVLINDDIIKVGETVDGLTVLRVDGNRAICEKNLRKFALILGGNKDENENEKKQDTHKNPSN